ncbi:MAG: hypothetical protein PSV46_06670 [Reyranella sp.]|nr:hypothetical protein [Reyranella sp.]
MIGRRRAVGAAGTSLMLLAPAAQSQVRAQVLAPDSLRSDVLRSDRLGTYVGAVGFYRSIPLMDIFPPPKNPPADLDDRTPISVQFAIRSTNGFGTIWLRIDGGPMLTSDRGETLRFGALVDGVAQLASVDANPAPRAATLTVQSDSVGTEVLFGHADGSFWRRHFTVRFSPDRIDLIVWVFDAAGTRARTWRGAAVRWD